MKLRKMGIFMFVCFLIISMLGCSKKESNKKQPVKEVEKVNEEENLINKNYVFDDDTKDNLAAMFFVGHGNDEKEEQFPKFLKKYELEEEAFDVAIDQDDCDWFALIPRYEGTVITVEQVSMDNNGGLEVVGKLIETKSPVLLSCNYSDIIPSTKVTITYNNEKIEFNPFVSLKDGNLNPVERVFTEQ